MAGPLNATTKALGAAGPSRWRVATGALQTLWMGLGERLLLGQHSTAAPRGNTRPFSTKVKNPAGVFCMGTDACFRGQF